MILPLLPLSHAFLGFLSIAWGRSARATLICAFLFDAAAIGLYYAGSRWFGPVFVGGWKGPVGIALAFDPVSLAFLILGVLLELAVAVYVWREQRRPYFFMLLHALFAAAYALILAQDLFNIYVILELLTLTSFLLVAYDRRARQVWASLKYLLLASLGMSLFLLGAAIAYGYTGSFNLAEIRTGIAGSPDGPWIAACAALLVAGVAVKAGIFSFSLWLPAAHSTASTAISALLSGFVINMGVVVLIRLDSVFRLDLPLLVLGAVTGIAGAAYAIASLDVKRLLAFSTLSQIGYLLVGLSLSGGAALTGVLAYAIAHGSVKGLLFLAAGESSRAVGSTLIRDLIGGRRRIPTGVRFGLLVGILGIIGIPPLAVYVAKGAILASGKGGIDQAILLALGVGSAASFVKLIPLLRPWNRVRAPSRTGALWVLVLPVVLFAPLAVRLFPDIPSPTVWSGGFLWKGFATIGAGLLLGRFLLHRPLPLPQRIFRAEFGVLAILAGFLLIYLLLGGV